MHCLALSVVVLCALLGLTEAYVWGAASKLAVGSPSIEHDKSLPTGHLLDATAFLEGDVKKSAAFNQAVSLLQSLERAPSCYRTAARVLVKSCQRLEDSWQTEHDQSSDSEHELMYHRYSYALSLAVCDLTVAKKSIDTSCDMFREDSLLRLPPPGHGMSVQISRHHIEGCMSSLTKDGIGWTSFNGNKVSAFTICQASREPMEREDILETYRTTGRVVESFGELLEVQLAQWKRNQEAQEAARTRIFNGMLVKVNGVFADFVSAISRAKDELTSAAQYIGQSLMHTAEATKDFQHELDEIFKRVRQQHERGAEVQTIMTAAQHDLAVNIVDTNEEVLKMQYIITELMMRVLDIQAFTEPMAERMTATEQASIMVLEHVRNMTEHAAMHAGLSADHEAQLLKQTLLIADLHNATQNASKQVPLIAGDVLTSMFSHCVFGVRWWVLVLSAAGVPFVGSAGLEPSLARNVGLMALGFSAPIVVNAVAAGGASILTHPVFDQEDATRKHGNQDLIAATVIATPWL